MKRTFFLVAAFLAIMSRPVTADIVTLYSFDGTLLDTAVGGVNGDHLTAGIVGGAGSESYAEGLVGQAVQLSQTTASAFVLTAPSSADLQLATDWTLEAYVKPDFFNVGEWDRFWTKWGEGSQDWHWAMRYPNNGLDLFVNNSVNVLAGNGDPVANSVPLGEWSHVAMVGNSSAGTITAYLNATAVGSAAYQPVIGGTGNMNFGNFATAAPNELQFTGLIDEAAIHNAAVDLAYLEARASLVPSVNPPDNSGVAPPPTSGLVSYYTFDDTTSDVAAGYSQNIGVSNDDLAGRGGIGIPFFESGQVGNALRIGVNADDVTDLRAPVSADVNLPATYTIEAWVNPSDLTGPWQRLVLNWGGEQSYHFAIRDIGGQDTVSLFHNQSNGGQPNANGGSLVEDEWQHIAGVADGEFLKVYLNGELVNQVAYDGTINTTGTEGLGIGDSDTSLTDIKFNGLLDDLAIWSVPLSAQQIRFQYQQGLAGQGALTVPEPTSLMMAMGLLGLLGLSRRSSR